MHTHIHWSLSPIYSPALDLHRVLYAYVHPRTRELLYIGKADKQTVRERLFGQHKQDVFNRIQHYRQINRPHILVGHPFIPKNNNFSSELLSDIESLLIHRIQPTANIQATRTRIRRPGLLVSCSGAWPHPRRWFLDL